jgi:beta-N-acetylhexosaminidase
MEARGTAGTEGAQTARELRSLGINLDLAPLADVDRGPAHVDGDRSFGSNPQRDAQSVRAFVTAAEHAGMGTTLKHFPGFGGADQNSDYRLARVAAGHLHQDLIPFRAGIDAGASAVMLTHALHADASLGGGKLPDSINPKVYDLLRHGLGFQGVAITDSMSAVGFAQATGLSIPQGAVAAIKSGADIVLTTGDIAQAQAITRAITHAVETGEIPESRLDEAVTRVIAAKQHLGVGATTGQASTSDLTSE